MQDVEMIGKSVSVMIWIARNCLYSDGIGESSLIECTDVKIVKILYAKLYYYNIN